MGTPHLLYVTPVLPLLTGNGLSMRAGMVLEALAAYYRISVLVVPLYDLVEPAMPQALHSLCERVAMVPAADDVLRRVKTAGQVYRECRFDAVHVFRLSTIPFARPYMTDGPDRARRHLDLDDIDSKTHRRIAALRRENGEMDGAAEDEAEARRSEMFEAMAFSVFHRVCVCSERDRLGLAGRCKAETYVVPNAVRVPQSVSPPREDGVFRLLFVGTLGYYPNHDAMVHFCTRILPLIRRSAPVPVEVAIVGGGALEELRAMAGAMGVELAGPVSDLGPYYERAHAVVVPLRAGGGTRIKILEAFSYARPVVSTRVGMEGLEAEPEEHLLVGDEPAEFAERCVELITDRHRGAALVENARSLLARAYSGEALRRAVACLAPHVVLRESQSDAG